MVSELEEKLLELIAPVVEEFGLLLYDVELLQQRGRTTLLVTIDRMGGREPGAGVTVDELVEVNRELSALLDVEDPIDAEYTLEVQSPGVERKLSRRRHFESSQGETVHVVFNRLIDKDSAVDGVLYAVDDEAIKVRRANGDEFTVPYEAIKSANTTWDWKSKKPGKSKKKKKRRTG